MEHSKRYVRKSSGYKWWIYNGRKESFACGTYRGDKLKFPENTIPASSATMGAECLLQITYMMQTEYLKNLK